MMNKIKIVYLTDTSIPTERVMEDDVQEILKKLEPYNVDITYVRDQKGWSRQQFVEYASEMEQKGADKMEQCEELLNKAKDADIIIANFAPVGSKIIEAAKKLKLICVTRSGAENVAIDTATENGIKVVVAPGRLADPVADYTVGLMLAESRNIARDSMNAKGEWDSSRPLNFEHVKSLRNKTVGIVGFGLIGRNVAKRVQSFGCNVIAYDPFLNEDVMKENNAKKVSMEELMSNADYVCVHARLTKETEGLVSKELIKMMKPSAFFINTARAGLVDEDALIEALKNKSIAGAGLDVFKTEPLPKDHPLMNLDNVTLTPHRAGGTSDLAALSVDIVVKDIERFLNGEELVNKRN